MMICLKLTGQNDVNTDIEEYAKSWTAQFMEIISRYTPTATINIDEKCMDYKNKILIQLRDCIHRRVKNKPKSNPLWVKHREI